MKGEKNPTKRPEVRKKISENNSMKRPEVRRKVSDSIKIFLENHPEEKERRGQRIERENNPNWNPNREEVYMPYEEKFFDPIYREQIKREQNYLDKVTEKILTKRSCLHHIDYDKSNNSRENLIWLNIGNHAKTNFNREEWKFILQKINRDIIKEIKMGEENNV